MPIYFYLVHKAGGAFGIHSGDWAVVKALVDGRRSTYSRVDSLDEARKQLRAIATECRRLDVLAWLATEAEAAARATRLAEAARLSAEFKAARVAEETAAKAIRRKRTAEARRLVEAAAGQLARATSLVSDASAAPVAAGAPAVVRATTILEDEPLAALFVSSSHAQVGGLAQCIILFTFTRVLWVNVRVISHGSHAQVQLSGILEGLMQAHARAIPHIVVHLDSSPLYGVLSGELDIKPKLRRLFNKISDFSSSKLPFQLVQLAPPPPDIEMARKLLADAHKPTKIAGLKRLRSF